MKWSNILFTRFIGFVSVPVEIALEAKVIKERSP